MHKGYKQKYRDGLATDQNPFSIIWLNRSRVGQSGGKSYVGMEKDVLCVVCKLVWPFEVQVEDNRMVKITTEAGEETIELQVTNAARPGQVIMPHGFGLVHEGETFGANVNRLAKNIHRDRLAGTPLHSFVKCRVEAA